MTHPEDRDPALDLDLMEYVDGTLAPERRAAVEARLARDPQAREAVAQWRHFDNVIHAAARVADDQPANLRIAALERELAAKLRKRRWQTTLWGPNMRRAAASVALFAAGWWAHDLVGPDAQMRSVVHPAFVESTVAGHSAYLLAAHERGQFGGDDMAAALDWLSDQMQRKIESPELERLGYRVESARLMEAEGKPIAVFYYRNPEDKRVTVSMAPRDASEPLHKLRVASSHGGRMAYWSSETLHYAVIGGSDVADVTALAAVIQR